MNSPPRNQISMCVAAGALIAAWPAPAEAHLNATGMGPLYDRMVHFLISPEDVVPVRALALLAGSSWRRLWEARTVRAAGFLAAW